eukprot:772014-Amphidinium_carterae.1
MNRGSSKIVIKESSPRKTAKRSRACGSTLYIYGDHPLPLCLLTSKSCKSVRESAARQWRTGF